MEQERKAYDYYGTLQTYNYNTNKYEKRGRVEAYKQFIQTAGSKQPSIKGTITFTDGSKMSIALWNQP